MCEQVGQAVQGFARGIGILCPIFHWNYIMQDLMQTMILQCIRIAAW
jgi:hypothetical protein